MGSYSSSATTYKNNPLTTGDGDNPINLLDAYGTQLGGEKNVSGSGNAVDTSRSGNFTLSNGASYSVLDGGAISKAFDFGTDAVKIIADLTRASNQTSQSAASGATMLATQAQNSLDTNKNQDALTDWTQNKTLIFGGVLVAIAYFYFRK